MSTSTTVTTTTHTSSRTGATSHLGMQPRIGHPTLKRLRCQHCGAWVDGARALEWTTCDPRTDRETTLWLCGINCPLLFDY